RETGARSVDRAGRQDLRRGGSSGRRGCQGERLPERIWHAQRGSQVARRLEVHSEGVEDRSPDGCAGKLARRSDLEAKDPGRRLWRGKGRRRQDLPRVGARRDSREAPRRGVDVVVCQDGRRLPDQLREVTLRSNRKSREAGTNPVVRSTSRAMTTWIRG